MITVMPMMMTYIKDSLYDDYHGVIRIPTTVVIELEVAFDDHNNAYDDVDEILYNDHHGYLSVLPKQMIIFTKYMIIIIFQGLAKSGAGYQRAEDSSAEHIAQVSNDDINDDE